MINITVNNNVQSIKDASSIETIVTQLEVEAKGIAIALNHTVISRTEWNNILLKENDSILIIKATQGG
jgi:sulfur carrier protein